jgi:hypothetical protein
MADYEYEIEVTEEDVREGIRCDHRFCMVATAIPRTVPQATFIHVDAQGVSFTVGTKRLYYVSPPAVARYIQLFDAGQVIEPFSFMLREPVITERDLVAKRKSIAQTGARAIVGRKPWSRTRIYGERRGAT